LVVRSSFVGIGILRQQDGLRKNILIANNTIYEGRSPSQGGSHGGAGIYIIGKNVENINVKNNVVSYGWGEWTSSGWDTGHLGQITLSGDDISDRVTALSNITFGPNRCSQDYPDCVHLQGLDSDPLFADRINDNFYLLESSPAIDGGVDLSTEGIVDDYEGNSRPKGNGYDLGAFEYDGGVTPSPTGGCDYFDFDCDGYANQYEFLTILGNFFTLNYPQADFNIDGEINSLDLSVITLYWQN